MTAPDLCPTKADVVKAAADGKGFWKSCSGCHESNEGHPTGPYHPALQCHVGCGCFECGGIGAVWDMTDYAAMGDYLAQDCPTPLAEAHPLAAEARTALARDDVAGWIGSLPKAPLAEALTAECGNDLEGATAAAMLLHIAETLQAKGKAVLTTGDDFGAQVLQFADALRAIGEGKP